MCRLGLRRLGLRRRSTPTDRLADPLFRMASCAGPRARARMEGWRLLVSRHRSEGGACLRRTAMDSFVLVPNRGRLRMHASTKDLDFAVDRHHGRPNEGSHRSRLLMSRGLGVRAATRGACACGRRGGRGSTISRGSRRACARASTCSPVTRRRMRSRARRRVPRRTCREPHPHRVVLMLMQVLLRHSNGSSFAHACSGDMPVTIASSSST